MLRLNFFVFIIVLFILILIIRLKNIIIGFDLNNYLLYRVHG